MTCTLAGRLATSLLEHQFRVMTKLAKKLQIENTEAIHDVRVASRRMRAAISEYREIFYKTPMRDLQNSVREITRGLSEARQLDVSLDLVNAMKQETTDAKVRTALNFVARELADKRNEFSANVRESARKIQSPEFKELYLRAARPVHCQKRCVLARASRRIESRYQDAIDAWAKWRQSKETQDLHRLRITSKKLRYTCETYKPIFGEELEDLLGSLKNVQDVLGEWHDWAMMAAYAAEFEPAATERPAAGFQPLTRLINQKSRRLLARFGRLGPALFDTKKRELLVAKMTPADNRSSKKGQDK
jgi:CHAD domain-containing protein